MTRPQVPVRLDVTQLAIAPSDPYTTPQLLQTLLIQLTQSETLICPTLLPNLAPPPDLDLDREVVLYGQVPVWLYGRLIEQCASAPWIGVFSAPLRQIVVICSWVATPQVGDTFTPQFQQQPPCPAILIGGPPNSGKSVFSNALRHSLIHHYPQHRIFLHRANWDGEGNWAYESRNMELVDDLVEQNKYPIHKDPETAKLIPDYFHCHAQFVRNLRSLFDILVVDVGGKPASEKEPLIRECSHYIIVTRSPDFLPDWQQLCQPHLSPVAIIHSVLEQRMNCVSAAPILELRAGPWTEAEVTDIPPILLKTIEPLMAQQTEQCN
jgi:CRISPR-associated protein Csx3